MITAHQKEIYINGRGARCPFCSADTEEVTGDKLDFYRGPTLMLNIEMSCSGCARSWFEIYQLFDMIEEEEDKANDRYCGESNDRYHYDKEDK